MPSAVDYRNHSDPEHSRWGRKYPRFPGVAECVRSRPSTKGRGAWVDIIFYELTVHASECLPELVVAFRSEKNEWVQRMVLMAITEARLHEAISFLAELARDRQSQF